MRFLLVFLLCFSLSLTLSAQQTYTIVSYNCENLFDLRHDSLKQDLEFLPEGNRKWTFNRYWRKINDIGRVILQIGGKGEEWMLPDIVGLIEVENDSVMHTLTRGGVLKGAHYNYVMTEAEDIRGIDVALMYNSLRIKLIGHETIKISEKKGFRRTRDILYAILRTTEGDTLHVFTMHCPSRSRGQMQTEPYRLHVVERLLDKIDSIRKNGAENVIVIGDFNDYSYNKSIRRITDTGLNEVSSHAKGLFHPNEVVGTYCFQQEWGSIDHIFTSNKIRTSDCYIFDADWMLEKNNADAFKPRRTYLGDFYHGGVSDHLPLVFKFGIMRNY